MTDALLSYHGLHLAFPVRSNPLRVWGLQLVLQLIDRQSNSQADRDWKCELLPLSELKLILKESRA